MAAALFAVHRLLNMKPVSGSPAHPPASLRQRSRFGRFGIALTDLLLLALPVLVLYWALATESGLRAVAAMASRAVPGLRIEGATGRLVDALRLDRVRYDDGALAIEARGVELDWRPSALLGGRIEVTRLALTDLRIARTASEDPPQTPLSLELPLALRAALSADRLSLAGHATPDREELVLQGLRATIDSDGRAHRLDDLLLQTPWGALDGWLALKGAAPFALQGALTLVADDYRATASLGGTLAERADIAVDARGHGLSGQARVGARPFAAQPLASLDLALDAFDPHRIHPAAPSGRWTVQARLQPREGEALALAGRLSARNAEPGRIDQERLPVRAIDAAVQAAAGAVELHDLAIVLSGDGARTGETGGDISGTLGWRASGDLPLRAALSLRGIDAAVLHARGVRTKIGGRIEVQASDARQQFAVALDDRGPAALALKAEGHLAGGLLTLARADLSARGARAALRGTLKLDDTLAFAVDGQLQKFDPSAFAKQAPAASLSASFDAAGRLQPQPDLSFALDIAPSTLAGQPLSGRAKARLQGQRLSGVDVALDWAGNAVAAHGAFGAAQDALDWTLDAGNLSALRALSGAGGLVPTGRIGGSGQLAGTLAAPHGRATLAVRALAVGDLLKLARADIDAVLEPGADGRLRLGVDVADLSSLQVQDASSSLPQSIERLRLDVAGTRAAHSLQLELRASALPAERGDTPLQPSLKLAAHGALGDGPAWSGAIDRLAVLASAELSATLSAPTRLDASPQRVLLDDAQLALTGGGEVRLARTLWTPERVEARGQARGVPLRLVWRDRTAGVSVRAPLRLGADWSLAARLSGEERIDGTLSLFREAGDVVVNADSRTELTLSAARIDLALSGRDAAAKAVLSGAEIGALRADLVLPLRRDDGIWLPDLDAPARGSATLDVPSLAWVGRTLRLDMSTAGRLGGEVKLTGRLRAPELSGRIDGDALAFALADAGVKLERGELRAQFDGDRLTLTRLSFESDNRKPPPDKRLGEVARHAEAGRLSAHGRVDLASARANIVVDIHRFVPLQGGEQWLMLSGDGSVSGSAREGMALKLALKADAGLFTVPEQSAPTLGDDVVVKGRTVDEAAGPPLDLAIAIDLGERLYFKGRGLDTRLAGQLALRDEGRGLRATGTIRTVDGRYRAYGQELSIERGVISFQGSVDNPGLNVRAIRPDLPVQAGVEVSGTVQKPRVRLVSDTAMPDSEKLSWIVLGRGQDRAGGSDLSLLATAASALLGGEDITGSLAQSLGLDQIALTQSSATTGPRSQVVTSSNNATTVGGQVVSVGKRLSSNALLTYEQGVAGATSVVKLTWNLTRHLALIGSTGTEQAVDVRYVFSFK
ncbi:translocation/assembly module TamB domain-containing protein [Methyloversatilis sp.]|uniref:translocation/assembly module TamB domain-containing protein n=1 Tax=Methyloversatilis sp. TaxID=2569862 RepID=UPI0035B238A1